MALFCLLASGAAVATATTAAAEEAHIDEAALHRGCDLPRDVWEAADPQAIKGCATACFSALKIVGMKARDHASMSAIALWAAAALVLILAAIGFVAVASRGGARGWTGGRILLGKGIAILLAFATGWGVYLGLDAALARGHAVSAFRDLWTMRRAGKTGASFTAENSMTCADERLKARVLADGPGEQSVFQPFAEYPGVRTALPELSTNRAPEEQEVAARFADMAAVLAAGEEIDVARTTPDGEVPTQVGPYRLLVDARPFPGSYPVAGLIGVVGGLVLGFGLRARKGRRAA